MERYAAYFRDHGWLVDSGVGGTFSFDVAQCCEWPDVQHAISEMLACNLLGVLGTYETPPTEGQLVLVDIYIVRIK
jgi:hypothetical protein